MTKHEIMIEYVKEKVDELTNAILTFNYAGDVPFSISFLTNYSGKVLKKYLRAADKEYGFVILITWPYSMESDNLNIQAMNFAQEFMDWIDDQNKTRHFPDFGSSCQIKRIESLQNMPDLATVDMENHLAQYQIPCRVVYFEYERR